MKTVNRSASLGAGALFLVEALEPRRMLASAYTIADLGPCGASLSFSATVYNPPRLMAINNRGQVIAGGGPGAFLYSSGTKTLLTTLSPKFGRADSVALNDVGEIAGTFAGPRQFTQTYGGSFFGLGAGSSHFALPDAFLYDGKRFHDLGAGVATGIVSSDGAVGISIRGDSSVGWSANGAFVYVAGRRHALKLPRRSPPQDIVAVALDAAGDVIVAADQVYLYRPHSNKPVVISPMRFSSAEIDSAGVIIGVVSNIDNPGVGAAPQIYAVNSTGTANLGAIGVRPGYVPLILGVNQSGDAVGDVQLARTNLSGHAIIDNPLPDRNSEAFIVRAGSIIDLNTLAPPGETGWTLQAAEAINDAGQIAAIGVDATGAQHYLLLTHA